MRPLLAAIISCVLIFGSAWYISFAKRNKPTVVDFNEYLVDRDYWIQLSRTFDCGGDADFDVESLVVRFRGETLINRVDAVPKEERIDIRPLPRVQMGRNEVYVMANPESAGDDNDWLDGGFESSDGFSDETGAEDGFGNGSSDTDASFRAVRIQVFRGEALVADTTLWQAPGASSISGRVEFEVNDETEPNERSGKTATGDPAQEHRP